MLTRYTQHVPDAWVYALYALATARVTLLIAKDELFLEPRLWVLNRLIPDDEDGEPIPVAWWRHKLAYLLVCIWCMPVWVAAVIAWPVWYWHRDNQVAEAAVTILALAMGASLLAKVGRDD